MRGMVPLSATLGLWMILGGPFARASDIPTYHREVERILAKHCQECHRPGQVAPFSLLTYEQTRKRARDIAAITNDRRMPPWHASVEIGGPFKDARVMSNAEIATLEAWAKSGAPKGDEEDAPPPKSFTSDWPLGPPDVILTPKQAYKLAATGPDELRVFVLPTGFKEGKWVSAVDYKPGNRKVVHHIIGAYETTGRARAMDERDDVPGYKSSLGFGSDSNGLPIFPMGGLSGWAPGKSARLLPEGVGRYIPAGADILLQVHYHRDGKQEEDATSIGLYFAKGVIDQQVYGGAVMPPRDGLLSRPRILIPAGDRNYEITGEMEITRDSHLFGIVPHMHLLGKNFTLTLVAPGKKPEVLIQVDQWDFNWQDMYEFVEPKPLPKGSKILMTAHFDNSEQNPSNPSKPPIDVKWGEQTINEMCIGFLQLTEDGEKLAGKPPTRTPLSRFMERRAAGGGLLKKAQQRKSQP